MKSFKSVLTSCLIPAMALLTGNVAIAQTVEPDQLTIAGDRTTKQVRQLYIRTDSAVRDLQVLPFDLNGTNGVSVFPGAAIAAGEIQPILGKANEVIVPVEFNLRQAPDSGEFVGTVRLSYSGGQLAIPVTLRVKDHWFLPLVMLVFGTGLGIVISAYRDQGRPRDQILMRVGQVYAQMEEDPDLEKAKAFKGRINAYLVEVKMELQGERWEEAALIIDRAEGTWRRWVMGRSDWLAQFEYSDRLKQKLEDYDATTTFVRMVSWDLDDALNTAPELEGPPQLREKLEAIAKQINSYAPLKKDIEELQKRLPVETDDDQKPLAAIIRQLDRQVDRLTPMELQKDETVGRQLEQLKVQVDEQSLAESDLVSKGLGFMSGLSLVALPPATHYNASWSEQAVSANLRIRAFVWTSYVLAVVLLAGAGFTELYVANSTFGANPSRDYFTLMAWGFGAEATRDAIAKVVQSWGLPGLKS
ncbi:hypothetical protein [Limnospira fusiformis]|uniref:Uncharacterized protein n=1 Tax=Limnospira indica PCC 8005 TaxID=376219 RepID=A0A9P1NY16_9CYAN|nr:conserved hypothetical protein (membrane) [Limnospira indica PCC 8005]